MSSARSPWGCLFFVRVGNRGSHRGLRGDAFVPTQLDRPYAMGYLLHDPAPK
jgi:hypothetical protein